MDNFYLKSDMNINNGIHINTYYKTTYLFKPGIAEHLIEYNFTDGSENILHQIGVCCCSFKIVNVSIRKLIFGKKLLFYKFPEINKIYKLYNYIISQLTWQADNLVILNIPENNYSNYQFAVSVEKGPLC